MSKTPAQFAAQCREMPARLQNANEQAVKATALMVTTSVRGELKQVVPSGRLSGIRRKPKLSAGFSVRTATGADPTALITARGPWQLVENDTKAHGEPNKMTARGAAAAARAERAGRKYRFRKRKVLKIPGVGFRVSVQHPGTKGQHPFRKGVDKAAPKVGPLFHEELRQALAKTFG